MPIAYVSDEAHYSNYRLCDLQNLDVCMVKSNENGQMIPEELKSVCKNVKHPREGKTVYIGSTWRDIETENGEKSAVRMVYEITERIMTADGQMLFMPDTEINMYCLESS